MGKRWLFLKTKLFVPLVLLIFPLAFFSALGFLYLENRQVAVAEDLAAEIRHEILGNTSRIDASNYVHMRFVELSEIIDRAILDDFRALPDVLSRANRRLKFSPEMHLFSSDGNLIVIPGLPAKNRRVIESLWKFLEDERAERVDLLNRYSLGFEVIFGRPFNGHGAKNSESELIPLSQGPGFWFWKKLPVSGGGVIFVVRELPCEDNLAESLVQRVSAEGSLRVSRQGALPMFSRMADEKEFSAFDQFLQLSGTYWRVIKDKIWVRVLTADSEFVYSKRIDLRKIYRQKFMGLLFLFSITPVLIIAWIKYCLQEAFVSVKVKFVALILYSVLLPVTGLFFMRLFLSGHQESVALSRVCTSMSEQLLELDRSFESSFEEYLEPYKSLIRLPGLAEGKVENLEEMGGYLYDAGRLHVLDLYNPSMKLDFKLNRNLDMLWLRPLSDTICRIVCNEFIGMRFADNEKSGLNALDQAVMDIIQIGDTGIKHLIDNPGKLHRVEFGEIDLLWYWNYFAEPGHAFSFVSICQTLKKAAMAYLKSSQKIRYGAGNSHVFFNAFCNSTGRWLNENDLFSEKLELLSRWVMKERRQAIFEVRLGEQIYLAAMVPGSQLKNWTLVALTARKNIQQDVDAFTGRVNILLLLILLIAVMVGYFLADSFLGPVGALRAGVAALKNRDDKFRIAEIASDEFGDLAKVFNEMLSEAHEMAMARVVQERLIPAVPPEVENFDISLVSISAADLGGDYCDVFVMPENRLCALIGDVTGHGVSSALLMAMAKTTVFYGNAKGWSIVRTMATLNRLIIKLLNREKRMTFFMAQIDCGNGLVKYSNAGHPYPVVCSVDGSIKELELDHFPLGTRLKDELETRECQLYPGDVVVFFTDGFIECMNDRDEEMGYERWFDLIRLARHGMADEIRDFLVKETRAYSCGVQQPDDLTLMILKYRAKNAN